MTIEEAHQSFCDRYQFAPWSQGSECGPNYILVYIRSRSEMRRLTTQMTHWENYPVIFKEKD